MDFSKCSFMSIEQQKIIYLLSFIDSVNYKTQEIYRNERSFLKSLNQLVKADILSLIVDNNYYNSYELTTAGKKVLIDRGVIPLEVKK